MLLSCRIRRCRQQVVDCSRLCWPPLSPAVCRAPTWPPSSASTPLHSPCPVCVAGSHLALPPPSPSPLPQAPYTSYTSPLLKIMVYCSLYMYTRPGVHVHINVHIHVYYMYVCMYVQYVHVHCMCVHVYMYIYTYITSTCIHVCTCMYNVCMLPSTLICTMYMFWSC